MKPPKILEICTELRNQDQGVGAAGRAANRARINELANSMPPYTDDELAASKIFTNVNPCLAARVFSDAARRLNAVSRGGAVLFSVAIDLPNRDVAATVSQIVTEEINRIVRKSTAYDYKQACSDWTMVLHGKSPSVFPNQHDWCPDPLAIEDFLVPDTASVDLSDVTYFAVYQPVTLSKMLTLASAKHRASGWNMEAVNQAIRILAESGNMPFTGDFAEKLVEDFKENRTWYDMRSTTARMPAYHFFKMEQRRGAPAWEHWIVADDNRISGALYKSPRPMECGIESLVSVQYADMAAVAPFRYHNVRGLGFRVYGVINLFNRLFCRTVDHGFEALNQFYRNVGETERDNVGILTNNNYSELPPGVDMVPASERYTVNNQLLLSLFDLFRQIIGEHSLSWTMSTADGTRRAMTATEALAQARYVQQSSENMISIKTKYQEREYREIARRFTVKGSRNKDVARFRKRMAEMGIPPEALDYDRWTVSIDTGGINTMPDLSAAIQNVIFENRGAFSPEAQKVIRRNWLMAVTGSAQLADQIEPMNAPGPSSTALFASQAMTQLLSGLPVALPSFVNVPEYASALFRLLVEKLQGLAAASVYPDRESVAGILNAAQHTSDVIAVLSSDPANQQAAGALDAMLERLLTSAEPFFNQSRLAGQALTPEDQAKVNAIYAKAQAEAEVNAAKQMQKTQDLKERTEYRMAAEKMKDMQELAAKQAAMRMDLASKKAKLEAEPE